jgi:hypothetical protein
MNLNKSIDLNIVSNEHNLMIFYDNRCNFTNNLAKEKFSTNNFINKKRFSYNN